MVIAVERSVIGLRTAIYDLVQPETGRKIRFLGMAHAARPEYYREIQAELDDCDVVFYEGVRGRVTRFITLVYRIPTWFFNKTGLVSQAKHINLSAKSDRAFESFARGLGPVVRGAARASKRQGHPVAQRIKKLIDPARTRVNFKYDGEWPGMVWTAFDSSPVSQLPVGRRLVHADMSEEMFDIGWRTLNWKTRVGILVLCPLLGIAMAFSQRLRKWAFESQSDLDVDDDTKTMDEFMKLVLYERDKVMIEKIEAFWADEPDYRGQAAGLFGAAHLPAIINHLVGKRGFQIVSSRWVMAIPNE